MRIAGMTISLLAVATEITTIGLWISDVVAFDQLHQRCGEYCAAPGDITVAATITSATVPVLLAIGIPLWAVGARSEKRLMTPRVSLSASGELRF